MITWSWKRNTKIHLNNAGIIGAVIFSTLPFFFLYLFWHTSNETSESVFFHALFNCVGHATRWWVIVKRYALHATARCITFYLLIFIACPFFSIRVWYSRVDSRFIRLCCFAPSFRQDRERFYTRWPVSVRVAWSKNEHWFKAAYEANPFGKRTHLQITTTAGIMMQTHCWAAILFVSKNKIHRLIFADD